MLEFFDACGVLILEGYGLTESCAAATLNTPRSVRFGSVGRPLPGDGGGDRRGRRDPDRGPARLLGLPPRPGRHGRDAGRTAGCASGDLGEIDADGYLHITGRKKDLIITSSGKNISPENLESALRETRWISQAVVAGDRRPYLVALVTLDPDEAPQLAAQLGIAADPRAMAARPARARGRRSATSTRSTRSFARIEQIKRFAILDARPLAGRRAS